MSPNQMTKLYHIALEKPLLTLIVTQQNQSNAGPPSSSSVKLQSHHHSCVPRGCVFQGQE